MAGCRNIPKKFPNAMHYNWKWGGEVRPKEGLMKSKHAARAAAICMAVLISFPAFGGPRASIGLGIPAAIIRESDGALVVEGAFPLPLAELGVSYFLPLGGPQGGSFGLGAGVRGIGFLIGTSFGGYAWPELQAEWRIGSLVAAARLGGGAVAGYSDSEFSFLATPVFFPDLSLWWAPGRRGAFRLGGGAFGKLSFPGSGSALGGLSDGVILYAGAKAAFGR